MNQKITKKIDNFIDIFNDFKHLQQQQKMRGLNDFNIFTTLRGGNNDEVRLHSRFLAFLLDPSEEHNQGDLFLNLFLQELGLNKEFKKSFDLKSCRVEAEYQNIDIYLTDGNKHIIIENKIWAGDQHAQIKRYIETINKENENLINDDLVVIYLSINRNKPSNYSLCEKEFKQDESNNKENCPNGFDINDNKIIGRGENEGKEYQFINLNYNNQIKKWLEKSHQQIANITNLSLIIKQYQEVIEKLYGVYKEKIMDLNEYLKNKENKTEIVKTMNDISEAFVDVKIQYQIDFWKELQTKLGEDYEFGNVSNTNIPTIENACQKYYKASQKNKYYGMIYKFANSNSRLMLIIEWDVYFWISDNNVESAKELKDKENISTNSNGWFDPKTILYFGNFENDLVDALSKNNRDETITALANEFKDLVKKIENTQ